MTEHKIIEKERVEGNLISKLEYYKDQIEGFRVEEEIQNPIYDNLIGEADRGYKCRCGKGEGYTMTYDEALKHIKEKRKEGN